MKIGIISDIHGNLPALKVNLNKLQEEKCDYIYCLGDMIGIGPFPKECLELLLTLPNIKFVMGNHEEYFVKGIKNTSCVSMSEGEKKHQIWVANSLNNNLKEIVSKFPYIIEENIEGVNVTFMHYPLNSGENLKTFKPIEKNLTEENMDDLFKEVNADLIFFGHDHTAMDMKGKKHYINVGSSGCTKDYTTHCTIVEFENNTYSVNVHKLNYEKRTIIQELCKRKVPQRRFLSKVFF